MHAAAAASPALARSRSPSVRLGRASPAALERRQRLMGQCSAASSPVSVYEGQGVSMYRKYNRPHVQLHHRPTPQQLMQSV